MSSLLKIICAAGASFGTSDIMMENEIELNNDNIEQQPSQASKSTSSTTALSKIDLDNNATSEQNKNEVRRKSVSFNEREDIFLIPTREEIAALISLRTFKNAIVNKKRVHFNKIVNVFPIPTRKALACIAEELWYSKDDIEIIQNDSLGTLI